MSPAHSYLIPTSFPSAFPMKSYLDRNLYWTLSAMFPVIPTGLPRLYLDNNMIRARTPTPWANDACICLVISYRCNEFCTEQSFWLNSNEPQHWKSCQIWKGWVLWERYGHTQLRPTIMKCLSHKISIWDNLCLFVISYMVLSEFALRRAFERAHIWPQGRNIGELPNLERMGVVGKIMRCPFMLGTVIKCPSHKISITRQFVFVCLYHIWC